MCWFLYFIAESGNATKFPTPSVLATPPYPLPSEGNVAKSPLPNAWHLIKYLLPSAGNVQPHSIHCRSMRSSKYLHAQYMYLAKLGVKERKARHLSGLQQTVPSYVAAAL